MNLNPPELDHYEALFSTLVEREAAHGFGVLSSAEATFFAVSVLLSDLNRGAFQLFFEGTSADLQNAVESGLLRLGFSQLLAPYKEAKTKCASDRAWLNPSSVGCPPNERSIEQLTDRVLRDEDAIYLALEAFARDEGLVKLDV